MLYHKEAVRQIVADSQPNPMRDWRQEIGSLKTTVRLDIPLRDPQETLHVLRYLAEELPRICLRIESETGILDQLTMAQQRLSLLRAKIMRQKRR